MKLPKASPARHPPAGPPPARRIGRRLRDALLLPLALILVPVDWAIREGARLLRRWRPLRKLEMRLAGWPPWAILPLFLIPEAMSHAGGFYAAYLLAQRKVLAATIVVVFVKGVGVLIALWIYQAGQPALMRIGWFAWAHGRAEAARHWALHKIRPSWRRARHVMRLLRRLAAIRALLTKRLGRPR